MERSNIWFFFILKTLGPLQFSKPPFAQPHGAEWAGWEHTGIARSRECWPRSRSWAGQQQLSPQPWGSQERATVTSGATSHQFCSGGLDSLLESGPDSRQNQLLLWSKSGACVLQPKKKKHLKKIQQNLKLVPIKKRVNTGASAASKSPSTAEPQWYQHKQEQEAAHWGATALLFFGGNSKGLVSPSLEHPAGHAATSLHLPAPAPPAALPCASQMNTTAVTQQKELVPDNPNPSLSIYGSPAPSILLPCPKRLKKKKIR